MQNNNGANNDQSKNGLGAGLIGGIIIGSAGVLFGIGMGIKERFTHKALEKERAKNAMYVEALRKHQAQINALKSYKEREAYMNMLWEENKKKEGK